MFSRRDFEKVDRNYFEILQATAHNLILRSKNTGHEWCISTTCVCGSYTLLHRHKSTDSWHPHARTTGTYGFKGCIDEIQSHDQYQITKDKERSRQRENRRRKRQNGYS